MIVQNDLIELIKDSVVNMTKDEAKESGLPQFSYSKLDVLHQCNRRYKLKYVDKNYSKSSTIPLEFGSLLHRVLEEKGNMILSGEEVDYGKLREMLNDGVPDEELLGVKGLAGKYLMDFYEGDNATGRNYPEKAYLFETQVLLSRMESEEWSPICTEQPFFFSFDGKIVLHGFIDRVDQDADGNLKVIDYKTSKKVFSEDKLKTPLQMFIYDLACYALFGKIPVAHEYDFICIDQQVTEEDGVCTKGYFKRGLKKLRNLLEHEEQITKDNDFAPNATPLCYWCDFAGHTPNADPTLKGMCPYYSLWTPTQKTFKVNARYEEKQDISSNRKFIF